MVLFLKRVRLLRYMEMREPLGTKCSGRASQRRVSRNLFCVTGDSYIKSRASQRRVSRNHGFVVDHETYDCRASQRRVSRNARLAKLTLTIFGRASQRRVSRNLITSTAAGIFFMSRLAEARE